jgi:hypothetical protein
MSATSTAVLPATNAGLSVTNPLSSPDTRYRTLQLVLFSAGAVLMPLGALVVCIGWYGAAHTTYAYDQFPYLLSGGLLGVVLSQMGGFLYFGAWLAKGANDQREASRQISDTMLVLADVVSRQRAESNGPAIAASVDTGAVPVLAGRNGTTVHRRDCTLIRHRDDLHVLTGDEPSLSTCRVCSPSLI